jgi:hypothetical protein
MTRIDAVMERYAAAGSLAANGAEIVAVADPAGARVNAALRRVIFAARDDPGLWDDIIQPAKLLRWRLATRQQARTDHDDVVAEIERQERRLRLAVTDPSPLRNLASAARAAAEAESPLADALLEMIDRTGPEHCLLVAASRPAQAALAGFRGIRGVRVLTASELAREETCIDFAYAVGPPRFFGAALVTAPAARSVSFVIPSWIRDRTLPSSPITAYADSGAMLIRSRTRTIGTESPLDIEGAASDMETTGESGSSTEAGGSLDDLFPQPTWNEPATPHREPRSDELIARKVLLDGGQAIWLDDNDGERIRTLDPAAPHGERVQYAKLATVQPGTYLLLRKGMSNYGAVDSLAARLLGEQAAKIEATQQAWKVQLDRRIAASGIGKVEHDLRLHGVKSIGRAWAWTDPSLILPKNDGDFRALLGWLGIPAEPTISNAKRKRRAHHQAGSDVREKLEQAVEDTDLAGLERDGLLDLQIRVEGFRDLVAARVLAVSPRAQVIPRHQARVLFNDRSARWLE